MDEEPRPTFSLIVPTRQRPRQLRRFLDSLRSTTRHPDRLEVVLVVDEDDPVSRAVHDDRLALKHVIVAPGRTMGGLNRAGCAAATGQFIMLLNDDVVARTRGWDVIAARHLRRFADGVVLLHVNDGLFGADLCTFPLVSRAFLELTGGICPADYQRYCIDDHIEQIFHLLEVLGDRRIDYVPEVLFEHHNVVESEQGTRRYAVNDAILADDQRRFHAHFAERKQQALQLKARIAGWAGSEDWAKSLQAFTDVTALRHWLQQARASRQRARAQQPLWRRVRECLDERGLPGLARALWRRLSLARP